MLLGISMEDLVDKFMAKDSDIMNQSEIGSILHS
jgi:hypothetical protein